MATLSGKSRMIKQLRNVMSECVDIEGNLLSTPRFLRVPRIEDNDRLCLVMDLARLLLCSDYISNITKFYLKNPWISYEGIRLEFKRVYGEELTIEKVNGRIYLDTERIYKDFGANLVIAITDLTELDIKEYQSKVNELLGKHLNRGLLNKVRLNLGAGYLESNQLGGISDEEFEEFLETILPYTDFVMKAVEGSISPNVLYHVSRIARGDLRSNKDKERYERIKTIVER